MTPPEQVFTIARYKGPAGDLSAYLGVPRDKTKKHPAIIWITGGFPPGGTGERAWSAPNLDNEQTAQAYRRAGVIMMYATLRGCQGNGGVQEGFLGAVEISKNDEGKTSFELVLTRRTTLNDLQAVFAASAAAAALAQEHQATYDGWDIK